MVREVQSSNPNTKVRVIRTDTFEMADLDVVVERAGDGRREKGEAWEKLGVFAKSQIESWSGSEQIKQNILGRFNSVVPQDVVGNLIILEPVLMLSNLSVEQL